MENDVKKMNRAEFENHIIVYHVIHYIALSAKMKELKKLKKLLKSGYDDQQIKNRIKQLKSEIAALESGEFDLTPGY